MRFTACWQFATSKDGMWALNVQCSLKVGSYQTAWALLHKSRSALALTVAHELL